MFEGFHKKAVYVVNRDDAEAMQAIREIFSRPMKPGMVIPLSGPQYEALQRSMMVLVPPPEEVKPEPLSRSEMLQALTRKDRGHEA